MKREYRVVTIMEHHTGVFVRYILRSLNKRQGDSVICTFLKEDNNQVLTTPVQSLYNGYPQIIQWLQKEEATCPIIIHHGCPRNIKKVEKQEVT
jgi:hypothetical protein